MMNESFEERLKTFLGSIEDKLKAIKDKGLMGKKWEEKKYDLSYLCGLSGIDINKIKNSEKYKWVSPEEFLELCFSAIKENNEVNGYTTQQLKEAIYITFIANIEEDTIPFLDFFNHLKVIHMFSKENNIKK